MCFLPDLPFCFCSCSASMCALLFGLPSYLLTNRGVFFSRHGRIFPYTNHGQSVTVLYVYVREIYRWTFSFNLSSLLHFVLLICNYNKEMVVKYSQKVKTSKLLCFNSLVNGFLCHPFPLCRTRLGHSALRNSSKVWLCRAK